MVWQVYKKMRANNGTAGIDEMSWADLDKDLSAQFYKLWNRLTSHTGNWYIHNVTIPFVIKTGGAV